MGEANVTVAVTTPHRGKAFQAAKYAINRLKQIARIW
ncbi:MAG: molybdenum cofactor biosynthesis protein MoaE [Anaerolineae bacterium]